MRYWGTWPSPERRAREGARRAGRKQEERTPAPVCDPCGGSARGGSERRAWGCTEQAAAIVSDGPSDVFRPTTGAGSYSSLPGAGGAHVPPPSPIVGPPGVPPFARLLLPPSECLRSFSGDLFRFLAMRRA